MAALHDIDGPAGRLEALLDEPFEGRGVSAEGLVESVCSVREMREFYARAIEPKDADVRMMPDADVRLTPDM